MSSSPSAPKASLHAAPGTSFKDSAELSTVRDALTALVLAVALTTTFYVYSLAGNSLNAGFVYTGDFWHACLAHLAKLQSLTSHGVFSGIDYSTHGGASEFFLRPNLYPYHPLALLASALLPPPNIESLIRLSVILLFAHSLLGCYFTMRLARVYLNLSNGLAFFIAAGYICSVQMVNAIGYPPYLFCAAVLPWAIYAALKISERPSLLRIIRGSFPLFLMLTGGYVALGVSCLAMAFGFTAVFITYVDRMDKPDTGVLRPLALAATPFALAGFVAAPLYLAIVNFHRSVPTAITSLFWSAFQMAEMPRTVLRVVSSRVYYQGPMYEFSLYWGAIPIIIGLTFFAGMKDHTDLSAREWRLLKFSAAVYILIALSIFGDFSAVSNLLYAVPGIGKMHIYQRHLLAGHLFFIISTALMLKAVTDRPISFATRAPLFVSLAVMAFLAHTLATNGPEATRLHINDYLVFEALLGAIYAAAQMAPGREFVFFTAAFLMFLVPLDHIYDYSSRPEWVYAEQQKAHLELDKSARDQLSGYLRRNSRKAIVKYVDLTPGLREYLSKNYPWFVSKDVALSSYSGYEMQLAAKASYLNRMVTMVPPGADTWVIRPDWSWVRRTGGDFVIYQEGDRWMDARALEVADVRDPGKVLRLPKGIVIAPLNVERLSPRFPAATLRGRYLRVQLGAPGILSLAEVRVRAAGGRLIDLRTGKTAAQSSTVDGVAGLRAAGRAVDGNTDGDWNRNSVTETNSEPNPWWQVDLGASETLDSVEVWNRTDCCGDRLSDYWIFVSDEPFSPSDTPALLSARRGVISTHQRNAPSPLTAIFAEGAKTADASLPASFDNGYVRALGEASITNFSTDGAASMTLDVDAKGPVKIEYLFWPNERLRFYIEGTAVPARIDDGLQTVDLPPGRHRLKIQYVNWPLRAFLALYCCYAMVLAFAMIWPLRSAGRWYKTLSRVAGPGGGFGSNFKWYTLRLWR